jgi:hypothetical protein
MGCKRVYVHEYMRTAVDSGRSLPTLPLGVQCRGGGVLTPVPGQRLRPLAHAGGAGMPGSQRQRCTCMTRCIWGRDADLWWGMELGMHPWLVADDVAWGKWATM